MITQKFAAAALSHKYRRRKLNCCDYICVSCVTPV